MNDPVIMYLTERGLSLDGLYSLTAEDVKTLVIGYLVEYQRALKQITANYMGSGNIEIIIPYDPKPVSFVIDLTIDGVRQMEYDLMNNVKIGEPIGKGGNVTISDNEMSAEWTPNNIDSLRCYDHLNIICYIKQPDRSTCTNCRHANPTNQPEPPTA